MKVKRILSMQWSKKYIFYVYVFLNMYHHQILISTACLKFSVLYMYIWCDELFYKTVA